MRTVLRSATNDNTRCVLFFAVLFGVAVAAELPEHHIHLLWRENLRFANLQGAPVLLAQCLNFNGKGERFLQAWPGCDHAVVGEQAGFAPGQGFQCVVGELLRPECSVRCATDIPPTGNSNHIVERRHVLPKAGQGRRKTRVGVDDSVRVVAIAIDVVMETPLRRWCPFAVRAPAGIDKYDVGGLRFFITAP